MQNFLIVGMELWLDWAAPTCRVCGVVRDLEKGAVGTRRRPKLGNA
jgi:hypothetical protein